MYQDYYRLGPLTLQIQTETAAQQAHLAACWAQLFRMTPVASADGAAELSLTLATSAIASPMIFAKPPAVRFGETAIWATEQGFHIEYDAHWVTLHQGHGTGTIGAPFWEEPIVLQRDFWQRIFFLLSRSANCHMLHANALLPPDPAATGGVLLVGDCGSGKTTLTMSLLAAGWRYVTDDSVLLQSTAAGAMGHAVRRGFAATQQTVAAWPWLAPALATGIELNRWKTLVDLDGLFTGRYVPDCRPGFIVFPTIANAPQSTLHPLSTMETFTTLIGQPRSGLLVEQAAAPQLLKLYQTLAGQCRGYQLSSGIDVFQEPARVSELLLQRVEEVAQ